MFRKITCQITTDISCQMWQLASYTVTINYTWNSIIQWHQNFSFTCRP